MKNLPGVRKQEPQEMFTFRIPTRMRQNINKTAKANRTTPSEVARFALKNLLQDD